MPGCFFITSNIAGFLSAMCWPRRQSGIRQHSSWNEGNTNTAVFEVKRRTQITGFPRSWKIIENPGKINFPGKSWKIDKNSKVMKKLKNY